MLLNLCGSFQGVLQIFGKFQQALKTGFRDAKANFDVETDACQRLLIVLSCASLGIAQWPKHVGKADPPSRKSSGCQFVAAISGMCNRWD